MKKAFTNTLVLLLVSLLVFDPFQGSAAHPPCQGVPHLARPHVSFEEEALELPLSASRYLGSPANPSAFRVLAGISAWILLKRSFDALYLLSDGNMVVQTATFFDPFGWIASLIIGTCVWVFQFPLSALPKEGSSRLPMRFHRDRPLEGSLGLPESLPLKDLTPAQNALVVDHWLAIHPYLLRRLGDLEPLRQVASTLAFSEKYDPLFAREINRRFDTIGEVLQLISRWRTRVERLIGTDYSRTQWAEEVMVFESDLLRELLNLQTLLEKNPGFFETWKRYEQNKRTEQRHDPDDILRRIKRLQLIMMNAPLTQTEIDLPQWIKDHFGRKEILVYADEGVPALILEGVALHRLLLHAIRYASLGGAKKVWVRITPKNHRVTVEVKGNGPAMSLEEMAFAKAVLAGENRRADEFQMRNGQPFGIGLQVIRRNALHLHASVVFDSNPSESDKQDYGTVIQIQLPVNPGPGYRESPSAVSGPTAAILNNDPKQSQMRDPFTGQTMGRYHLGLINLVWSMKEAGLRLEDAQILLSHGLQQTYRFRRSEADIRSREGLLSILWTSTSPHQMALPTEAAILNQMAKTITIGTLKRNEQTLLMEFARALGVDPFWASESPTMPWTSSSIDWQACLRKAYSHSHSKIRTSA